MHELLSLLKNNDLALRARSLFLRRPRSSCIILYLYYCNLVWASTYQSNLHRIILLQKRVVRILSRSNFDAHTDPIFKELHIMKFCDICSLQMGQFMFSYKHGLLPACFDSFFIPNSEVHSDLTRNAKSFHLPLCRTNICQFSIRYQGPKFFNSLGDEIVNSVSFQTFVTINSIHSISTIHRIR